MLILYFSCSLKKILVYIKKKKKKDSIVAYPNRKECRALLRVLTGVFLLPYWKQTHEPKKYALSTEKPTLLLRYLLLGGTVFPN